VVPTHFVLDNDQQVLVHLARPNPVWSALQANPQVVLSIVDDYAYVPTTWRAPAGTSGEEGVPTSYYAAVQLQCHAEIVDDPDEKADLGTGSRPTLTSETPAETRRRELSSSAGCSRPRASDGADRA